MKDKAKYEVLDASLFEKTLGKDEFGVYKVEHIHIQNRETVETNVEGKKKNEESETNENAVFAFGKV